MTFKENEQTFTFATIKTRLMPSSLLYSVVNRGGVMGSRARRLTEELKKKENRQHNHSETNFDLLAKKHKAHLFEIWYKL